MNRHPVPRPVLPTRESHNGVALSGSTKKGNRNSLIRLIGFQAYQIRPKMHGAARHKRPSGTGQRPDPVDGTNGPFALPL